jgi:hypothetical protein
LQPRFLGVARKNSCYYIVPVVEPHRRSVSLGDSGSRPAADHSYSDFSRFFFCHKFAEPSGCTDLHSLIIVHPILCHFFVQWVLERDLQNIGETAQISIKKLSKFA